VDAGFFHAHAESNPTPAGQSELDGTLGLARLQTPTKALLLAQVTVAKCLASHDARAVTGIGPGIAVAQAGLTSAELPDLGAASIPPTEENEP